MVLENKKWSEKGSASSVDETDEIMGLVNNVSGINARILIPILRARLNKQPIQNVVSSSAILDGTKYFIGVSYTITAPVVVTLPLITLNFIGIPFTIADTGANASVNNITVNRAGSNTIIGTSLGETNAIIRNDGSVLRFIAINLTTWKIF